MKQKKTRWIVIGAVLALLLLIWLGRSGGGDETAVAVDTVATHTIVETVNATGKIYPEQEIKISPEVSGEIIGLYIQEGDSVHAGQVLARINPATYSSVVSQAQASVQQSRASVTNTRELLQQSAAQLEQARSSYNRSVKLHKDKVISTQEFEQADATYKGAKASYEATKAQIAGGQFGVQGAAANLAQAQANLQKTTIVAPAAGTIAALNVKEGERVVGTAQMAGTEMLTIANLGQMEVRADVSETEIARVKVGDTARIEADAYRGQTFTGVVSSVSISSKSTGAAAASADQVTNYTVRIRILPLPPVATSAIADAATGPPRFKPGMSASVDIITRQEKGALAVPVNAVTTRSSADSTLKKKQNAGVGTKDFRQVVFVVNRKAGTVEMRDVITGIQDNTYLSIVQGLKAGEEVVTAPYSAIARTLKNGQKIKVVKKEALFTESGTED